jgi:hypothetical protein
MSRTHIPAPLRRLVYEHATIRLLQINHPDRIAERELLIAAGELRRPD